MKIKKGYRLKNISGRQTVVPDRRIIKGFDSLIILNSTATYLWEMLCQKDCTSEELTDSLKEKFQISYNTAKGDTEVFIKTLRQNGIIDE